jgi:Uma2 family endonuclease
MVAPALTVHGIEIPWSAQTLDGFRTWVATLDEHGPRVSFARGKLHVEMSPQSYDTHEPLVQAINVRLSELARALDVGRYFLPPSWFTHEPTELSTEPDGFFARWSSLEGGDLRVNPERSVEALGRPDMALEVVSASSQRKDLVEHVTDYAMAGISEYWIADARHDEISFRILVLGADGTYVDSTPDADGWARSPIWQRSFRIRRLPPRAGFHDFTLEMH